MIKIEWCNARMPSFSLRSLLEGGGLRSLVIVVQQLPNADRDQRKDEGSEKDVGERAVAGGDKRNETEAAREEHADGKDNDRDSETLHVR